MPLRARTVRRGPLYAHMRADEPFGLYRVCRRALGRGILSVMYGGSRHKVSGMANVGVSAGQSEVIDALLSNDPRTITRAIPTVEAMDEEERNLVEKLIVKSCYEMPVGVQWPDRHHEVEEKDDGLDKLKVRFDIAIGEIRVGNDSRELKEELRGVLGEMVERDVITTAMEESMIKKYC